MPFFSLTIMLNITISPEFKEKCPQYCGAAVIASVKNSEMSSPLWKEIDNEIASIQNQYDASTIKERPSILATRQAYRTLGKDPSRYRPACEQLARRVIQGKGLYQINTIVDIVNLLSLHFGYAAGAIDADKIEGRDITLGIGRENEPYEGIGRGILNISNLPIYRDKVGGFATPTSDSTRTMVSLSTTHLLVLINNYDGDKTMLQEAVAYTKRLLSSYAEATDFTTIFY